MSYENKRKAVSTWANCKIEILSQLFENKCIRTAWDEEKEKWCFSIVGVVAVLTDQADTRHAAKCWSVLKTRLKREGGELTTNCSELKMTAEDGKCHLTDAADTGQLLRITQSILAQGRTVQDVAGRCGPGICNPYR